MHWLRACGDGPGSTVLKVYEPARTCPAPHKPCSLAHSATRALRTRRRPVHMLTQICVRARARARVSNA